MMSDLVFKRHVAAIDILQQGNDNPNTATSFQFIGQSPIGNAQTCHSHGHPVIQHDIGISDTSSVIEVSYEALSAIVMPAEIDLPTPPPSPPPIPASNSCHLDGI